MFYVHPWEVDPHQPRMMFGSRTARFRHYVNQKGTEQKLDRLLQSFSFGLVRDIVHAGSSSKYDFDSASI